MLLLLSLSSTLLLSGCRRKPVDPVQPQTETETQKMTETETEKTTEKVTEKVTEKQTEKVTEKQTEKPAAKPATEKQTDKKQPTSTKTTVAPSQPVNPSPNGGGATNTCPYCCGSFSTVPGADGVSEYTSHVGAEEAYIEYTKSQGTYTDPNAGATTPSNQYGGTATAQCPYCWGWYSTDSTYGYSEYSQHLAAEEANSYQQSTVEYTQCPYCGLWIDPYSYQDHITYGY